MSNKKKRVDRIIHLTERHGLSFDKHQFTLHERAKPKDENWDGNWEKVNYASSPTYHPTISNVIKHIDLDKVKDVLNAYYEIKDFGEKFDYLVSDQHNERINKATMWFERFELNDETMEKYEALEKKYKDKCSECKDLRKELNRLKGLGDESDATSEVDPEKTMNNPDMSIR